MASKRTHREYFLAGLFALLALFPLVTDSRAEGALEGSATGDAIERAFTDRAHQSARRRLRWSILRDCGQSAAETCPDVNDADALKNYWLPVEHSAADTDEDSVAETIALTLEDLSGNERHILRRAMRIGQCLPHLDGVRSGFQALCEQTIGTTDVRLDQLEEATARMQGDAPSQHYRLKAD